MKKGDAAALERLQTTTFAWGLWKQIPQPLLTTSQLCPHVCGIHTLAGLWSSHHRSEACLSGTARVCSLAAGVAVLPKSLVLISFITFRGSWSFPSAGRSKIFLNCETTAVSQHMERGNQMVGIEGWNREPKHVPEPAFLPHLRSLWGLRGRQQNRVGLNLDWISGTAKINYFTMPWNTLNKSGVTMGLPVCVFIFWEVCTSLSVQALWPTPAWNIWLSLSPK